MKRHLLTITVTFLLIMSGVSAFIFYADPVLLFHYRDAGAGKLSRIDQFHNMRFYKPLHVNRIKPDTVIIGTSRSGSLPPQNPHRASSVGYNFSMPGITISELSLAVKHAQANRPLDRLIIGLDYDTIISRYPIFRPGFEPARMALTAGDFHSASFITQKVADLRAALLSFDMLEDSILALAPKHRQPREFEPDGSWKSNIGKITGRGGYIYVAKTQLRASNKTILDPEENLSRIYDLLDFCYRNDIETTLFFTPFHAFFVDFWLHMSSNELWRNTHTQIVAMNEELAANHNRPPFDIWGFNSEAAIIGEPVHQARSKANAQAWFNDGVHFRTRLSERIEKTLWGTSDNFGQKLTTDTIDGYLDKVDAIRLAFISSNQKLVTELRRQIGVDFQDPE